ncbi:protein ORF98 [Lake sturgeon herpesvirus]|nr:protein ORF98 [Lake sturgeon herpesvirus]
MENFLNETVGCLQTLSPVDLDVRKIPDYVQREVITVVRAIMRNGRNGVIEKPQWMERGDPWYFNIALELVNPNRHQRHLFIVVGACINALHNGYIQHEDYLKAVTFTLGIKADRQLLRQFSDMAMFSPLVFTRGFIKRPVMIQLLIMLFFHKYIKEDNVLNVMSPHPDILPLPYYKLILGNTLKLTTVELSYDLTQPVSAAVRNCLNINGEAELVNAVEYERAVVAARESREEEELRIERQIQPIVISDDEEEDDQQNEEMDHEILPIGIINTPPHNNTQPALFGAVNRPSTPNISRAQTPPVFIQPALFGAVNRPSTPNISRAQTPPVFRPLEEVSHDEIKRRTIVGMLNDNQEGVNVEVIEGPSDQEVTLNLNIVIPSGIPGNLPDLRLEHIHIHSCFFCLQRKPLCFLDCCGHTICADCYPLINHICPWCRDNRRYKPFPKTIFF